MQKKWEDMIYWKKSIFLAWSLAILIGISTISPLYTWCLSLHNLYPYAKTLFILHLWNIRTSRRSWGGRHNGNGAIYNCGARWRSDSGEPRTSKKCYQKFWIRISRWSPYYRESRASRSQKKMTPLWPSDCPRNPLKRVRLWWRYHKNFTFFMRTRTRWISTSYPMNPSRNDTRESTWNEAYFPSHR